jgi:predicted phosphodiesterase
MRLAVISDIHGNCLALEAVLEDIARRGVDLTVNLGDLVSGPIEPRRTAELLIGLDLPTLAGNHERYLTTYAVEKLSAVDRFAMGELDAAHLAWMGHLPKTQVIADEVFMCHGTPSEDHTPWLENWFHDRNVTLPDEAAVTAVAQGVDYPMYSAAIPMKRARRGCATGD